MPCSFELAGKTSSTVEFPHKRPCFVQSFPRIDCGFVTITTPGFKPTEMERWGESAQRARRDVAEPACQQSSARPAQDHAARRRAHTAKAVPRNRPRADRALAL